MPVTQVGDHETSKLQPDHVYVIAPDRKLEITDTAVGASNFEQPRGQRTAIDLFFRSLAAAGAFGHREPDGGDQRAEAVPERGSAHLGVAGTSTMQGGLDQVLPAAIELHAADFGIIQLVDAAADAPRLRIVAQPGFSEAFIRRFTSMGVEDDSSCARALRLRRIVQVPDVAADPAGARWRDVAEEAGYRATQSTPLVGRDNEIVGVLSVYFREPHVFAERDQQLGVVLGQQAAGLIQGRAQQESLRTLNEALRMRTAELEPDVRAGGARAGRLDGLQRGGGARPGCRAPSTVVFADVSMPGMTGSELARRLRREFPAGVMTLVAVTGHNSSHPKVLDGDFDRHMLKPVTVDSVAALLGSLARGQDS